MKTASWRSGRICTFARALGAALVLLCATRYAPAQEAAATSATVRQSGTVKAVFGNSITLAPDSGPEVTIVVQEGAKLLRVAPGQKDLKDAKPIQLSDIQTGDRILVRGTAGAVANTLSASSVIDMAQTDLAAKQARDREEWQRHGVGGLVTAVDSAGGSVTVTAAPLGEKKTVTVRVAAKTLLRRYSPDSTRFDDAKPAPIGAIRVGDQLRARGTRSDDGAELKADEIVSGAFRSLSGVVLSIDATAGTLTLQDLATKKPVTVKVTAESQLRKLPAMIAQRIAVRLRGLTPEETQGEPKAGSTATASGGQSAPTQGGGRPAGGGMGGGMGRPGGGTDFQAMISRMPAASLVDLQKGDAVMLVATEGSASVPSTVITLLGGVEPILQASPTGAASTVLSPWSLSGTPAEGGVTP